MKSFLNRRSREVSALSLSVILVFFICLTPGFNPAETMSGLALMNMLIGIFILLLIYLTVQAYPIIKEDIGTPGAQNLDSVVSMLPGIVALFGIIMSLLGFWPLSGFWIEVLILVLLVVAFDLFIIGGAAAKILYLTDEMKVERR